MKVSTARAALYVRMSTESQDYSTDHQRAKIREYAQSKGLLLVREYVDDGKSGLDLKRRAGLRTLMDDVQSGSADFSHIIVYDVSRWGRFQDVDEAAYHEHTCRRVGIQVVYCAEKFSDDGSPYSALLKGMKRVMAAEYSRELSDKVFYSQCRFIEKGFKQGGHAGYGLRRLAITARGSPRAILEFGESKIAATDRVVLVLGPDHEVATVKRVYKLYVEEMLSEPAIARLLNLEGIQSEFGRPWTQHMVKSLLTNLKYCGTLAYNRRSCKLSTPRKHNSRDEWLLNTGAVAPIVSCDLFQAAQTERTRRNRRYSVSELLELLQVCYRRYGKVTASIIASDAEMPDPQLFVRAFGSLIHAYDTAGLPRVRTHAFVETKRQLQALRRQLLTRVIDLASRAGATVYQSGPSSLRINDGLNLYIEVLVCRTPARGFPSWRLAQRAGVDFTIAARIDRSTKEQLDYFLVPASALNSGPLYFKISNLDRYSTFRHDSLTSMFGQ